MRYVWTLIIMTVLAAGLALAPAATAGAADAATAVAEKAAPAEGQQPAGEAQPAAQPKPAVEEKKADEQPKPAAESPKPAETPKEAAPAKHVGPEGIKWAANIDEALKTAKAENKPLFIMFRADWCGYCKMMESRSLPDAKVKEELAKFVSVQVDFDVEKDTVKRFEVEPIPALFVTDAGGKVLAKVVGFQPAETLVDFLAYGGAALTAAKNPADPEAAFTLAVRSPAVEERAEKRLELVKKALELMGEGGDKSKRGRVLLVRGEAVAMAEPPDFAAAVKDIEEIRGLDPNNEAGVKEDADWLMVKIHFLQGKDKDQQTRMEDLGKDVEKFLGDYPADKVKKPRRRYDALWARCRVLAMKQDLAGTIAALEQFKAENKELLPPQTQQIEMQIQQLKTMLAAQQQPPAPKPEEPKGQEKPEAAPKTEEPKGQEKPEAAPKTGEPAPKVEQPKTGEKVEPATGPKGQVAQPAPAATTK